MPNKNCDGIAKYAISKSPAMMVPYYLMGSYCYYVRDTPILTDGYFDELCKALDAAWDDIEHMHKHAIDRAQLKAGTCLLAREAYPSLAKAAACALADIRVEPADLPPKLVDAVQRGATPVPTFRKRGRPVAA